MKLFIYIHMQGVLSFLFYGMSFLNRLMIDVYRKKLYFITVIVHSLQETKKHLIFQFYFDCFFQKKKNIDTFYTLIHGEPHIFFLILRGISVDICNTITSKKNILKKVEKLTYLT